MNLPFKPLGQMWNQSQPPAAQGQLPGFKAFDGQAFHAARRDYRDTRPQFGADMTGQDRHTAMDAWRQGMPQRQDFMGQPMGQLPSMGQPQPNMGQPQSAAFPAMPPTPVPFPTLFQPPQTAPAMQSPVPQSGPMSAADMWRMVLNNPEFAQAGTPLSAVAQRYQAGTLGQ